MTTDDERERREPAPVPAPTPPPVPASVAPTAEGVASVAQGIAPVAQGVAPVAQGTAALPGAAAPAPAPAPAPRPAPARGGLPIGTLLLVALTAAAVYAEYSGVRVNGRSVVKAFGLLPTALTWPRDMAHLVTALFVHPIDKLTIWLLVFSTVSFYAWGWAARAERALGTGPFLFTFLAAGAAGNVIRLTYDDPAIGYAIPGSYPAILAVGAAYLVVARKTRDPQGSGVSSLLYRAVFVILMLLGPTMTSLDDMGNNIPLVLPSVAASLGFGWLLGFAFSAGKSGRPSARLRLALLVASLAIAAATAAGTVVSLGWAFVDPAGAFKADPDATLERVELSRLKLSVRLPRGMRLVSEKDRVSHYAAILQFPQVIISTEEIGRLFDEESIGPEVVRSIPRDRKAVVDEAPRPFKAGKRTGYVTVAHETESGMELGLRIYGLRVGDRVIVIIVFHQRGDDEVAALADAIAASLKEAGPSSDKTEEPEKKGR